MKRDGTPYLKLDQASYLIGMVGLNELVKIHCGQELHESKKALKLGLRIIAYMKLMTEKLKEKHTMRFVLEQTPAESTAYRFAKLDLENFSLKAENIVKGEISKGEVYYTNSTYLNVGIPISPIERVRIEGLFHPLIEAGSLTHIWLGEQNPDKEALANFEVKTFKNTTNDQIAFSPEFTSCQTCQKTSRGLQEKCPFCGSSDIEGITRITGYFTKTGSWNKGKLGELKDRYRNANYFINKNS